MSKELNQFIGRQICLLVVLSVLALNGCQYRQSSDKTTETNPTTDKPISTADDSSKPCISEEEYRQYTEKRKQIENQVKPEDLHKRTQGDRKLILKLNRDGKTVAFQDQLGGKYELKELDPKSKCDRDIALFTLLDNLSEVNFYILLESHCLDCEDDYIFRAVSKLSGRSYILHSPHIKVSPAKEYILDFDYDTCASLEKKHPLTIFKLLTDKLSLVYRLDTESLEDLFKPYLGDPPACKKIEAHWITTDKIELWMKDQVNPFDRKLIVNLKLKEDFWIVEPIKN
ncbi:MAG: hypothetical protein SFT81_01135 [Candidatus Caenarcaniphilales bacterium]|nr:hypothetical protein [Candidatus Caenarcaniphilales bacterium]